MPPANNNSITIPLPKALPQAARKKVEAAIESHLAAVSALTAFLDEAEVDTDLEPSLAGISGDDREYDPADPPANEGIDENELDVSYNEGHGRGGAASTEHDDQENSLGWPNGINQAAALKSCRGTVSFGGGQWTHPMDGEPEPSLGSLDGEINQAKWSWGDRREMEEQCEDEGHDSDSELDIEADREPPCAPFELVQDGAP